MKNNNNVKTRHASSLLGIDYGKSKIGLAVADCETKISFAYGTVDNDKNFLDNLRKIIEKENIGTTVIGEAKYFHNAVETPRRGVSTMGFLTIAENLEKMGIKIEYQEEMFSTKMAENNLREKGAKKIKRFDNQEAAKIILQSWLDKQNMI